MRGRTLGTAEKLELPGLDWKRVPGAMVSNRGSHGAVLLDGMIYVVGGGGLKSNLGTVEMLNPEK